MDLRWGVRPGTEAFDGAATQCLMEVAACQKVSVGPNFVVGIIYFLIQVINKLSLSKRVLL